MNLYFFFFTYLNARDHGALMCADLISTLRIVENHLLIETLEGQKDNL